MVPKKVSRAKSKGKRKTIITTVELKTVKKKPIKLAKTYCQSLEWHTCV